MSARKSAALALVDGTARRDRPRPVPVRSRPKAKLPGAPDWLDPSGKAKWRALIPALAERNLLTGSALSLLELICDAYGEFRRARAVERRESSYEAVTESGATLHRQRPEVEQAIDAWKRFASMLARYDQLLEQATPVPQPDRFEEILEQADARRRSRR